MDLGQEERREEIARPEEEDTGQEQLEEVTRQEVLGPEPEAIGQEEHREEIVVGREAAVDLGAREPATFTCKG